MSIMEMHLEDVASVLPLYLEQYNQYEGGCWTEETAGRRIRQVLNTDDAFALMMKGENGSLIGFVMGYFKQYDDLVAYTLDEIVISHGEQGKGYGTMLLRELENCVRERGAAGIELVAVKDELHERYYEKAGYRNTGNFVLKCKWFE